MLKGLRGRLSISALDPLYKKQLPISRAKKADLLSLCQKMVIPEEFHCWYAVLVSVGKEADVVADPGVGVDEDAEVEV